MEVRYIPTVYIRKDHYENIVKMGMNPTDYLNTLLDKSFSKSVTYTPLVSTVEQHDQATLSKKKVKKDA